MTRLLIVALLFLGFAGTSLQASNTSLTVVYPKPAQVVHAVDSTFIFGNVTGDFDCDKDWLEINGHQVPVHPDGGFLAFLPVAPGEFGFYLKALRASIVKLTGKLLQRPQLLVERQLFVAIPEPRKTLTLDTLQILNSYRPPPGDLVLAAGNILPVMFQGTPDAIAWFSIENVVDSVAMSEMEPRQQPYWGESVFGVGAVPDSILIRGVYAGFYVVPDSVSVVATRIEYHLGRPTGKYVRQRTAIVEDSADVSTGQEQQLGVTMEIVPAFDSVSQFSRYRVSLNDPQYPFTVRFSDSVQTIRHAPRLGYFAIFQPTGVEALVVGRRADWYRLKLSHSQYAWANENSVTRLPTGILPPYSRPAAVRTYSHDDHVMIEIALSGQHPFRIYEDDSRTLRLQLFGVTTNTDWVRYDFDDSLIELITWSQPEDGLYELTVHLSRDLWGYDTYYEGNTFKLRLNRAPDRVEYLWGKTIVVDPGHSSDAGAIGPTGLTEAEANLGIALELERMLIAKGAKVIMTRSDMSHVALYDRPAIAKQVDADLFISIHNNALPDGVNPFDNHGVAAFYYHPHSADLAKAIQTEMLRATGMPDFGLYHGNLAVNRPTQYPAVLIECAFMMIPEQEALLKTDRYRRKVATAITKGIESFLEQYDGRYR